MANAKIVVDDADNDDNDAKPKATPKGKEKATPKRKAKAQAKSKTTIVVSKPAGGAAKKRKKADA